MSLATWEEFEDVARKKREAAEQVSEVVAEPVSEEAAEQVSEVVSEEIAEPVMTEAPVRRARRGV